MLGALRKRMVEESKSCKKSVRERRVVRKYGPNNDFNIYVHFAYDRRFFVINWCYDIRFNPIPEISTPAAPDAPIGGGSGYGYYGPFNWNREVMYTPTIKVVFGIVLFQQSDSYKYSYAYNVGPTQTNYYVPSYNGESIDKTVNLWGYTGDSSPSVLVNQYTVVMNPGSSYEITSQVDMFHEAFSVGWGVQTYTASYYLRLYGDPSETKISGSSTWDGSMASIPLTFSIDFPVEFD